MGKLQSLVSSGPKPSGHLNTEHFGGEGEAGKARGKQEGWSPGEETRGVLGEKMKSVIAPKPQEKEGSRKTGVQTEADANKFPMNKSSSHPYSRCSLAPLMSWRSTWAPRHRRVAPSAPLRCPCIGCSLPWSVTAAPYLKTQTWFSINEGRRLTLAEAHPLHGFGMWPNICLQ